MRAGGPEGAFEHETGGAFGPEGVTSEELEPGKSSLPEPEADETVEDSSDDESEPEPDQGGQSSLWRWRSGKLARFPSTGEGRLDTADQRQHYNQGGQ